MLNFHQVFGQNNPVFDSAPVNSATYGELYDYNIEVSDADGDVIEVINTTVNMPAGISLTQIAGDYSLSGTPTETGAFTITLEVHETAFPINKSIQSFTLTISKANLSVTADNQNITYGDAIPTATFSYAGFVNGEDKNSLTTEPTANHVAAANSDAGDYDIVVQGGTSNNYAFDYTNGTLSIAKANQTITFPAVADKAYGDTDFSLSASSDSGLPITYVVTSGPASIVGNVVSLTGSGQVTIDARQAGTINYNSAAAVDQSFTVSKASLSVTADNQNITYGDAIPIATFSYSGFVNGEDKNSLTTEPTANHVAAANSDAGDYDIVVQGGTSNNYAFDYTNGTLSIAKANQTITFPAVADKTYGDIDFSLSASSDGGLLITYVVTSGPASIVGNVVSLTGAGQITIEAQQAGSTNYNAATAVPQTFTVSKASLSVTADNQNITYGDAIPTATFSYSGFVNGDDKNSLTTEPTANHVAAANSDAGDYDIVVQGGTSNDYAFDYTNGTLSIAKANAAIQVTNTLQNFDGNPKEVQVTTTPENLNVTITYNGNTSLPITAGTYSVLVTIIETNYTGQEASELIINSKPTTSGIPTQQVNEDSTPIQVNLLNYFTDTEDDDSDLVFEVTHTSNPDLFSDVEIVGDNLKISFEPNANGMSSFTIKCTDTDGLYIEEDFDVKIIAVQDDPFFTSTAETEVQQNEDYSYLIKTKDFDEDDVMRISSVIALPSWLSLLDNGDGTALLSGSTSNETVGVYGMAIQVSDDKNNSAVQFFDIEVIDVNDLPTFTSSPVLEANVNESYAYSITTDDIDNNDEVTVSVVEKPSWLSFSTASLPAGSALLQGTPTDADRNVAQRVKLKAVDLSEGISYQSFTIDIDFPNSAPTFTSQPITVGTQNELYQYKITVEDIDEDPTTVKALSLPTWLSLDTEDLSLSGVPENDDVGENEITIEVEDFLGLKTTQSFTIEVENVNDAPIITSTPKLEAIQNQLYEYQMEVEDVDVDDMVSISVVNKPHWLSFDDNNRLSGTPQFEDVDNSPFEVKIKATDIAGAIDYQSFEVKVVYENNAPTINPIQNPVAVNEDTDDNFIVDLTGITDGDGATQEINVTATTDLRNLFEEFSIEYQSPNSTAKLHYKILPDSFGTAKVTIKVEDAGSNYNNFVERSFQIEVVPVNDVPVFTSNPKERTVPAVLYRYEIEVFDADPEDELTLKKMSGPDWLVLKDTNGVAKLEGQVPDDATSGQVSISVTDLENASSTQSFVLVINTAPDIADMVLQTDEDVPYEFQKSDFTDAYIDDESDEIDYIKLYFKQGNLQLEGQSMVSGDSIDLKKELDLQYIPPQDFSGEVTLNWSASDGFLYSELAQILITVDTVNDQPILSNVENTTLEFVQGSEPIVITESITVSDIDDGTLDTAWVQISDHYNDSEDRLTVKRTDIREVKYEFNQDTGMLLIHGELTKSDYELVLRSVTYQNINSLSSDTQAKTISFTISDGQDLSKAADRKVKLGNVLPSLDFVNAFTPDGSGVNDTWDFKNLEAFEQIDISVYNSQGVRVFHCTTNNCEWDGSFQNKELPAGAYFYLIKLDEGRRKYEGNVTILR